MQRLIGSDERIEIVSVLASAGGVVAMSEILSRLPANFPVPILYHQPLIPGRARALVHSLMRNTGLHVQWLTDGEQLEGGNVYLCPAGFRLEVNGNIISLARHSDRNADLHAELISAVSSCYGHRCALVLLGDVAAVRADTLRGHEKTGIILSQLSARFGIHSSSSVSGMVLPLADIPLALCRLVSVDGEHGARESWGRAPAAELKQFLDMFLDKMLSLHGTAMGNIQLLDSVSAELRIVVQQGFRPAFLRHFWAVTADDGSTCGRALRRGETVVIEDVDVDEPFAPHREAAIEAGFRAVQSTPLISSQGNIVGMLSTHFEGPRRFSAAEILLLKQYCAIAGDVIDRLTLQPLGC